MPVLNPIAALIVVAAAFFAACGFVALVANLVDERDNAWQETEQIQRDWLIRRGCTCNGLDEHAESCLLHIPAEAKETV